METWPINSTIQSVTKDKENTNSAREMKHARRGNGSQKEGKKELIYKLIILYD